MARLLPRQCCTLAAVLIRHLVQHDVGSVHTRASAVRMKLAASSYLWGPCLTAPGGSWSKNVDLQTKHWWGDWGVCGQQHGERRLPFLN